MMHAYHILGFFFTAILGTLSHFFYEWSNQNTLVGLFSPVNESTWEHMKLIFFPVLVYVLVLVLLKRLRIHPNKRSQSESASCPQKRVNSAFYNALLFGNLSGTISIPFFFYTYSGILGKHLLFLDILTFLAGLFITFYFTRKLENSKFLCTHRRTVYLLTVLFAIAFFIFTFFPPKIGLFQIP